MKIFERNFEIISLSGDYSLYILIECMNKEDMYLVISEIKKQFNLTDDEVYPVEDIDQSEIFLDNIQSEVGIYLTDEKMKEIISFFFNQKGNINLPLPPFNW